CSAYDASKRAAERVAADSGRPVACLRFGTVCGGAPRLRVDLLLNKMAHDAKTVGAVTVTPGGTWRPVPGPRGPCPAVGAGGGGPGGGALDTGRCSRAPAAAPARPGPRG